MTVAMRQKLMRAKDRLCFVRRTELPPSFATSYSYYNIEVTDRMRQANKDRSKSYKLPTSKHLKKHTHS